MCILEDTYIFLYVLLQGLYFARGSQDRLRVFLIDFLEIFDTFLILFKVFFVRDLTHPLFPEGLPCLCLFLHALDHTKGFQVFRFQDLSYVVFREAGQRGHKSCLFSKGTFFFLVFLRDKPGPLPFRTESHARDAHLVDNNLAEEELCSLERADKGCYLDSIRLGIIGVCYFNPLDRDTQRSQFQVHILDIDLCADERSCGLFHDASHKGIDQHKPQPHEESRNDDECDETFPAQPLHHEPPPGRLSEVYALYNLLS